MRSILDYLPKPGTFLEKHLVTRPQSELLEQIRNQICEAYDQITASSDAVQKTLLHLEQNEIPLLVDRGSRKEKLTSKTLTTSAALFLAYYPLAIAQLALKSLEKISRLRYNSPLNPQKITDETDKALENIFISLDRIFRLETQEISANIKQTLNRIKLELIHELRPFFNKTKYFENAKATAENVLDSLSQAGSISMSEKIRSLIPSLNPTKPKIATDVTSSISSARENLNQLREILESTNGDKKQIAKCLKLSHIVFSDFDLFLRAHISLSALFVNGFSQMISYSIAGIPGPKLSALASPAPVQKLSKAGPEADQQKLVKEMILYLDDLYKFEAGLNSNIAESNANDSEKQLKYHLSSLITKLELNLYPYVNHATEYRNFAKVVIENSDLKYPNKIIHLLEINEIPSLLNHLVCKSPELASMAALTVGVYEVNHRFTDESAELLEYFNTKILKDEQGKDILDLDAKQKKAIDNLMKFFVLGMANDLKAIIMMLGFASTAFNDPSSRRKFFSRIRLATLGGASVSFGVHKLRYITPPALEIIKANIPQQLKGHLQHSNIPNSEIDKLAKKLQTDGKFIMRYFSYLINNAGPGPLTALMLYNNPDVIENATEALALKLEEFAAIAQNLVRVEKHD
jgi:hypothetical protein